MRLGALVVIGTKDEVLAQKTARETTALGTYPGLQFAEPLACVEVIGRSTAERMIEHFLNAEVEAFSAACCSAGSRADYRPQLRNERGSIACY